MFAFARIIVAASFLGVPALAGPTPAPVPEAAPKVPAPKAAKRVTIKYQGTLREALKEIANKGGINLVITGELKDPAEVYLNDVPADEALQIVADAHSLKVRRQGSIWTIRPLTGDERSELNEAKEAAAEAAEEAEPEEAEEALAFTPPTPPTPPGSPFVDDDGDAPDPVTDPKGFQRHIEERVQRDVRDRLKNKFRSKRFWSGKDHGNGNDVVGTGHLVVNENQTVGDAVAYGGGLEVRGHVEGDAVAFGGGVHLSPSAEVDGDVYSFGGGITREDGASVGGEEVAFGGGFGGWPIPGLRSGDGDHADHREHRAPRPPSSGSLPAFLAWFALLFGGGFLAMMFAPNRMRLLEAELRRDPLRCGVTGLLGGLLGLPALSLVLIITIIGIPVALGLWAVVAVGCLMGIAALANEIGARLPLRNVRKTQAVVLAAGVLLMELVGLIPVLGGLTWAAIAFLSLGTVIRSRFGTRQLGPVPG